MRFKNTLILDIETGPLSDDALLAQFPFEDVPYAAKPFRTTAKTEETRQRHRDEWLAETQAAREEWDASLDRRRLDHLLSVRDKAALHPLTGQVLALAYAYDGSADTLLGHHVIGDDGVGEDDIVAEAWTLISDALRRGGRVITFNGHAFDIPFLRARAIVLGVELPSTGSVPQLPKRYLPDSQDTPGYHDMLEFWCGGTPKFSTNVASLRRISVGLGLPEPKTVMEGKDFAANLAAGRRSLCDDYLTEEAEAHWALAERLGY